MTDFATRKNTSTVQNRVAGVSLSTLIIDPSTLASYPAAGDTIEFFDLPAGARIIDAFIRVDAAVGVAGTTLKLQTLPSGGSATDLTATTAADAASSARMAVSGSVIAKQTVVQTIQAVPGTHALSIAGNIEVGVLWSF